MKKDYAFACKISQQKIQKPLMIFLQKKIMMKILQMVTEKKMCCL